MTLLIEYEVTKVRTRYKLASTSKFKACSKCLLGRRDAECKFLFCVKCYVSHVVSGEPQAKCMVKTHIKRASAILVAPDKEQRMEVEDGKEEVVEEEQVGEEDDGNAEGNDEDNDHEEEDGDNGDA